MVGWIAYSALNLCQPRLPADRGCQRIEPNLPLVPRFCLTDHEAFVESERRNSRCLVAIWPCGSNAVGSVVFEPFVSGQSRSAQYKNHDKNSSFRKTQFLISTGSHPSFDVIARAVMKTALVNLHFTFAVLAVMPRQLHGRQQAFDGQISRPLSSAWVRGSQEARPLQFHQPVNGRRRSEPAAGSWHVDTD